MLSTKLYNDCLQPLERHLPHYKVKLPKVLKLRGICVMIVPSLSLPNSASQVYGLMTCGSVSRFGSLDAWIEPSPIQNSLTDLKVSMNCTLRRLDLTKSDYHKMC